MKSKGTGAKGLIRLLIPILVLLMFGGGQWLLAQTEGKPVWEFGLSGELFSRGIKWQEESSTLKSTNATLALIIREITSIINLTIYGGIGMPRPNGIIFDRLPLTLEYQAGSLNGLLAGVRAEARALPASDFNFGLVAEVTSFSGFNKNFDLKGLVVPATATARLSWIQATAGFIVTYDALENSQPFLEIAGSYLQGKFRMKEVIEDLSGEQTVTIKSSGYASITAGWNFYLVDKITVVPRVRFIPGTRSTFGGSLSIFYGF